MIENNLHKKRIDDLAKEIQDPEFIKLMEHMEEGHLVNLDIERLPAVVWHLCRGYTLNIDSLTIHRDLTTGKDITRVRCRLEHESLRPRTY